MGGHKAKILTLKPGIKPGFFKPKKNALHFSWGPDLKPRARFRVNPFNNRVEVAIMVRNHLPLQKRASRRMRNEGFPRKSPFRLFLGILLYYFSRVKDAQRIEGLLETPGEREFGFARDKRHEPLLRDADAVLARKSSA